MAINLGKCYPYPGDRVSRVPRLLRSTRVIWTLPTAQVCLDPHLSSSLARSYRLLSRSLPLTLISLTAEIPLRRLLHLMGRRRTPS
jgi:hypothetical protein